MMHSMKLKSILSTAIILAFAGSPEAWATQHTLVRTRDNTSDLSFSQSIPSYRTECQIVTVFGPDPSCGSHESCSDGYYTEELVEESNYLSLKKPLEGDLLRAIPPEAIRPLNRDHRRGGDLSTGPNDDVIIAPPGIDHRDHGDHGDNGGSGGGSHGDGGHNNDWDHDHHEHHTRIVRTYHPPVCTTVYESCEHQVNQCSQVLDHWTNVDVQVVVDPTALLLKGEQETLRFDLWESEQSLRFLSSDSRYHYLAIGDTHFDLSGESDRRTIRLDVESTDLKRPPNDLEIVSVRYETPTRLKITFKDPQIGIRAQMREVHYLFELYEGKRKLVRDIYPILAAKRPNGLFEVIVNKGDRGWRADPSPLSATSVRTFKYSVRRDAYYLQNDFTMPKSIRVFGAGGIVK